VYFNLICFQLPTINYLFIIGYPGEKGSIGPIVSILSINKGFLNHNLKYLKAWSSNQILFKNAKQFI